MVPIVVYLPELKSNREVIRRYNRPMSNLLNSELVGMWLTVAEEEHKEVVAIMVEEEHYTSHLLQAAVAT